jgi:hypothetical protein
MKTKGVHQTSTGIWQVTFSEGGKQKTLYLGRDFDQSSAVRVGKIVSDILTYRKRGEIPPAEIFRRILELPERIRRSFERHGLVAGVSKWTLSNLVELVTEQKKHLAFKTRKSYKRTCALLVEYFGKGRCLDTITKLECEQFKNQHLSSFAACSVSRHISRCRTVFRVAVDNDWLQKNPFDKVVGGTTVNRSRQFYIDRATINKIIVHCRDDYDRLLLALARFGGFRIPSEVDKLRYRDFTEMEIRIHKDTRACWH